MATTIITQEDLDQFKVELFTELKQLMEQHTPTKPPAEEQNPQWLKSHQVQRLLKISPGTLQNLRINGTLPYTKIGGVIFYSQQDLNAIMERNKRNHL